MSVNDEEMQPVAADNNVATAPNSKRCYSVNSKGMTPALSCGSCFLIVGLISLILFLAGFFTFEEPTLQVESFIVDGVELGQGESSGLIGLLPTQATLQLQFVLQVNNTNSYKIHYKALEPGTIHIPEFLLNGCTISDGDDVETSDRDFLIGNWQIPDGTLDKRSSSQTIPLDVSAFIDLAQPETLDLATLFLQGGEVAFLIHGAIEANTWVPFAKNQVGFFCLVQVDNILAFGDDARIRCRTSS